MTVQPWKPTAAQEEAALALSDPDDGGLVRTHPDGTAELRTLKDGAFHRYLIRTEGTATLVESRPRTWHYLGSIALGWLGIFLALGAFLPVVLAIWDDFWGAMIFSVGLAIFGGAMFLYPYGKPPPGESWTSIGGAGE